MEEKEMMDEVNTDSQQSALNDDEIAGVAGGKDMWRLVNKAYNNVKDFVMPDTNKAAEEYLKNAPEPFDFNRNNDI